MKKLIFLAIFLINSTLVNAMPIDNGSISLRQYFAAKALVAILSDQGYESYYMPSLAYKYSKEAWDLADAMIQSEQSVQK